MRAKMGLAFGFFIGLLIIPGLDVLLWYLLHPTGFWQRVVVLGIEFITALPRIFLAILVVAGITTVID